MTSTLKIFRVAALAGLLAFGTIAQAEAAVIVTLEPPSQTVQVGDPVSVDLVVSGLTEEIGGFQAILSFDDVILSGFDYVIDPDGNFDNDLDLSFGFSGGTDSPLDLFMTGDPAAGQPTSFILATINFTADALGKSALTLSSVILSDAQGNADIFPGIRSGSVCVADGRVCPTVPEPGLLALLGAGLSGFVVRRRAARASRS